MSQRLNYFQHSPDLVRQLSEMSQVVKNSLDTALIDLINIRASQINGCAFCVDMHVKEAKIHGERDLRVHHVAIWRESPLFSDREKAAFEWTELLTKPPEHGISNEAFERLRAHFSDKEISDLTFAVSVINMWNRLSISFRPVPGSADKMFGLDRAGLK